VNSEWLDDMIFVGQCTGEVRSNQEQRIAREKERKHVEKHLRSRIDFAHMRRKDSLEEADRSRCMSGCQTNAVAARTEGKTGLETCRLCHRDEAAEASFARGKEAKSIGHQGCINFYS
jgi:hypothetical protein